MKQVASGILSRSFPDQRHTTRIALQLMTVSVLLKICIEIAIVTILFLTIHIWQFSTRHMRIMEVIRI